jgi:anti-sigma B factor antagonist
MTITIKKTGKRKDITIIYLKGKIMDGPETTKLQEKIEGLIAEGSKKIIIDLAEIDWINASGLGVLLGCLKIIKNHEAETKLSRVSRKVKSMMETTRLIEVFDTYETVQAALVKLELEP